MSDSSLAIDRCGGKARHAEILTSLFPVVIVHNYTFHGFTRLLSVHSFFHICCTLACPFRQSLLGVPEVAALLGVPTDAPSMDELSSLAYLDSVLRESLRIFPAVPLTIRQAAKDNVIPLGEPIVDRYGRKVTEVRLVLLLKSFISCLFTDSNCRVKKGDQLFIPITAANRMTSLWGSDAQDFK